MIDDLPADLSSCFDRYLEETFVAKTPARRSHPLMRVSSSRQVRGVCASVTHDVAVRRWLHRFPDQAITYTDATSFAVLEAERCPQVATVDHDFTMAGFDVIRG